jgi:hypothetical protein
MDGCCSYQATSNAHLDEEFNHDEACSKSDICCGIAMLIYKWKKEGKGRVASSLAPIKMLGHLKRSDIGFSPWRWKQFPYPSLVEEGGKANVEG